MFFITSEADLKFRWNEYPVYGLYFYRSGMPLHSKIIHVIEQLQQKHKSTSFYAVDAEQFGGSCIRFGVTSVPTLVVLGETKEIKRLEGTTKTQDFVDLFDDICSKYGENHAKKDY